MGKIAAALVLAAAWATGARAEDAQVKLGPPAAWVQPAGSIKTDSPDDGAAVRLLLMDTQLHFGPEGTASYTESAIRVQTPQGLQTMSTVTLPWDPALGDLTVHRLRILRGGQTIDLLAGQKFTVLRRESNLEAQQLDGVLTAVLQPEDLRVGDVVDMAYSLTSKDPALAGHVQWGFAAPNIAIDDLRLRATADRRTILWRAAEGFEGLKPGVTGEGRSVSVAMQNVQPLLLPENAPGRFRWGRLLEFADFRSWAEVSAVMSPLYAKASTLAAGSPLQAEIARIKAASADPKTRAEAALALVEDQVRYVALSMDDGGYVPADADATWSRRFGDCKGKTTLLLALLKGLGVDAQPVLASTQQGDGLDQRLPSAGAFDHVLVRATIAGKAYWLDGTRLGDRKLEDIPTPDFVWVLPVQAAAAALIHVRPGPLDRPDTVRTIRIDATAGLDIPAPTHAEVLFRGDVAFALENTLANLTPTQRDASLRKFWSQAYSFLTVTRASAAYDPVAREERILADGVSAMAWEPGSICCRLYEADGYGMGWNADFTRPAGLHADAPFSVIFPSFEENRETIVLPNKGANFTVQGEDVDRRIGAWSFHRSLKIDKGVFTLDASTQSLAPEFSPANTDAEAIKAMSKVAVYVVSPRNYPMTRQELDQYAKKTLTSAAEFMQRGRTLRDRGRFAEARADMQSAVALDPKSTDHLAELAEVSAMLGDFAAAHDALKKAAALKPDDDRVYRAGGYVSMREAKFAEAAAYYTKALDKNGDDKVARRQRILALQNLNEVDKALADTEILLKGDARNSDVRRLRVDILATAGRNDMALAEADAFIAAAPKEPYPHRLKGAVLERLGRIPESQAEYDQALALNMTAEGYFQRANDRRPNDHAARLADAKNALKLDPKNENVQRIVALSEAQAGDVDAALARIQALLAEAPDDQNLRGDRAYIYVKANEADLAAADIEWLRGHTEDNGGAWNSICYDEAMWGLTLEKALADCDKAVSLSPRSAAILDSRAFVLLRLERLDDAIAVYDQALTLAPRQADSLFGRGVARLRKGQVKDGQADLSEARRLSARIDDTFAEYGVKPPPAYASSNSATK
jgi:tetratricopeptide (TPR) repeat protein/transglutaminase-like putative cysteine protease